jgi:AraC-like DNA-binding protein
MQNLVPGIEPGIELLGWLRPYVRQCGDAPRPAWRLESRKLLDYLLVYIEEGRGVFEIGGEVFDVGPGDLFWVPPDTEHTMEGHPPRMVCPYVHFDLRYRPEYSHWDFSIPPGMTDLGEVRPLMHPPAPFAEIDTLAGRLRTPANRRVGALVRAICTEAARGQSHAGLLMSGLLTQAVAEILRGRAGLSAEYDAHIPRLERAAGIMAAECASPLRMADLADVCGLSVSRFRHLFARHFGCPPRTYLRRARIHMARDLMVGTPLTLTEIAERTGFETVHSFSRAFHAVEGMSPSQYRKCGTGATAVEGRRQPYAG